MTERTFKIEVSICGTDGALELRLLDEDWTFNNRL